MSNRQGVAYDADNLVTLTPGSLTFNGTTYDIAASGSAAAALQAALIAQATANAALPKAGGTMTGDIDMSGTQKVMNMATPTAPGDATTKLYVDNLVTGVLRFKGSTDCSTNPNYPAATLGDAYVVSVGGKIGGAAGVVVEAGDVYFATATNPGGTQAAVGSSWDVVQYNLNGVLLSANNLSDVQSAATSRTNLGLGSAATYADTAFAKTANNLSDLASAATARTNLGLGTAATQNSTAFATAAQGTLASTAVQRAGDTMSGSLTIGSGANLVLTGGAASGQGNIQMAAAASAAYDTNLLYLDNTSKTMGFLAGSTPTFVGSSGPFFAARGNTYSAYANQRGNMFFYAGIPSAAGALEGSLAFATNDIVRLFLNNGGKITINNATTTGTGLVNIAGSATAFNAGDPTVLKVTTNLTAVSNGDAYHSWFAPTLTKQSSGTHGNFINVLLSAPTIAGGAATVTNAATFVVLGAPTAGTSGNYAVWVQGGLSRFDGTFQLGSSGTALSQVRVYTPSLTPASVSAGAPAEQTFTVTGLATTDTVTVNAPGAAVFNARVSAANTLAVTFMPPAAGSYTPPAGTYRIVAIRS